MNSRDKTILICSTVVQYCALLQLVSVLLLIYYCHEMHDTVYTEAKLNSNGKLRCHAVIWRQWQLMG